MKGLLQSIPVVGRAFVDITPEQVWGLWRHMQTRFGTKVLNKESALEMQLVAQALDAIGLQSRERFLRSFTTTVGRHIYTPFEVGVPQGGWDLWNQVVVCAHEHQHVIQHDREGLAFEVAYLADPAARARFEVEAYRSTLEIYFWRYGTTPSTRRIAAALAGYGCRREDIEVSARSLALVATAVRTGAVLNEASQVALAWLDVHVPHLRARVEA